MALDGVKFSSWSATLAKGCPTHAGLAAVLEWVEQLKPKRTILIHMGSGMDYRSRVDMLPLGIEPRYAGMGIIF